ncbi:MAG TPA: hypothetical protein VLM85_11930 [Polyangiaceae bacterium]|nr:hypothetical protein [Polyangiaceae bacterium]
MSARRMLLAGAALAAVFACSDPVHDAEVAALGPEDPGTPTGPTHRPGQPCLTCHGDLGPAHTRFAAGGTIYQGDLVTPASGATVTINDAAGNQVQATTNDAGNFYVPYSDFQPVFPLTPITVVGSDPNNPATMITHIGRDASCASCHFGSESSASSPGPIYLLTP